MRQVVVFVLIAFSVTCTFAQHSLTTDDGAGRVGIIQAPTSGGAVQIYSLPPGGGELLTTNSLPGFQNGRASYFADYSNYPPATTGVYSFYVPQGVSEIMIEIIGAGGGGGAAGGDGSDDQITAPGGGAGGNGGAHVKAVVSVSPDDVLDIIVGAGGLGGATINGEGDPGYDGEVTEIWNYSVSQQTPILRVNGGKGGGGGSSSSNFASGFPGITSFPLYGNTGNAVDFDANVVELFHLVNAQYGANAIPTSTTYFFGLPGNGGYPNGGMGAFGNVSSQGNSGTDAESAQVHLRW